MIGGSQRKLNSMLVSLGSTSKITGNDDTPPNQHCYRETTNQRPLITIDVSLGTQIIACIYVITVLLNFQFPKEPHWNYVALLRKFMYTLNY